MQIAINVNDSTIAEKILDYLKSFKKDVTIETYNDADTLKSYMNTQQFQEERDSLHETLSNIKSEKTTLREVDDNFWNDMDKVIVSA
ncbi:MAG: hypothetical protein WC667_02815 [Sulfurimonas sp.]|jgi:hypothetical protein